MVTIAQKILRKIIPKKKERILREISEEELEQNKKLNAQSKYIQSLEAQISRRQAKDRKEHVEEQDNLDDIELIKQLERKSEEIKRAKYIGSYDLARLFRKLEKDKRFSQKFEIVDKDDKTVFDKFKTLLVLPNGNIGIKGKSGEIWAEGPTLRHIIHKPESIRNQIRRGRILLPYDENFNILPDLENLEHPEMTYDDSDYSWHMSEERVKKIKELIIERDKEIQDLREDKEHHEQLIADLRNKIKDMELAKNSWMNQSLQAQTQLSVALANEKERNKRFLELDRDLTVAQEQKLLADDVKQKYEDAFKQIIDELEDEKSKTLVKRAKLEVWNDIKRARKMLPKEVLVNPEEKEENKEGGIIKR